MKRRRRAGGLGWAVSVVLLGVLLSGVWMDGNGGSAGEASAQFPDPAKQRNLVVAELQRLNQQVAELRRLFSTGKATVTVATPKRAKQGSGNGRSGNGDEGTGNRDQHCGRCAFLRCP